MLFLAYGGGYGASVLPSATPMFSQQILPKTMIPSQVVAPQTYGQQFLPTVQPER